jgi:hypothetical protein
MTNLTKTMAWLTDEIELWLALARQIRARPASRFWYFWLAIMADVNMLLQRSFFEPPQHGWKIAEPCYWDSEIAELLLRVLPSL